MRVRKERVPMGEKEARMEINLLCERIYDGTEWAAFMAGREQSSEKKFSLRPPFQDHCINSYEQRIRESPGVSIVSILWACEVYMDRAGIT
jgi:hypothetical protein